MDTLTPYNARYPPAVDRRLCRCLTRPQGPRLSRSRPSHLITGPTTCQRRGKTPHRRDRAQSVQIHLQDYRPLARRIEADFSWTDMGPKQDTVRPCTNPQDNHPSSDKTPPLRRLERLRCRRNDAMSPRAARFRYSRSPKPPKKSERFRGDPRIRGNRAFTDTQI